jgi:hypothetical protein
MNTFMRRSEIPYIFIFCDPIIFTRHPYITPAAPSLPLSSSLSLSLGSPHCSGGTSGPMAGHRLENRVRSVHTCIVMPKPKDEAACLVPGGLAPWSSIAARLNVRAFCGAAEVVSEWTGSRRRRGETARAAVSQRPHNVRGGGARRPLRTGTMCDSKRHLTFQFESMVLLSVHGVDTGCIPCRLVMRML